MEASASKREQHCFLFRPLCKIVYIHKMPISLSLCVHLESDTLPVRGKATRVGEIGSAIAGGKSRNGISDCILSPSINTGERHLIAAFVFHERRHSSGGTIRAENLGAGIVHWGNLSQFLPQIFGVFVVNLPICLSLRPILFPGYIRAVSSRSFFGNRSSSNRSSNDSKQCATSTGHCILFCLKHNLRSLRS